MINIRRLTTSDSQAFFDLRMEGLRTVPTAFGGSFEEESHEGAGRIFEMISRQNEGSVILGAFDGEVLVGSIGIYRESGKKSAHKTTIWGMFVNHGNQRQGLGRKLVQAALQEARKMAGVTNVGLSVESSNVVAKSLYESCGFKSWGKEPMALFVDGKFYDEDHMIWVVS